MLNSKGVTMVGLDTFLTTMSTFIVAARLYARTIILKQLGIDDAFALFAWMILIARFGVEVKDAGEPPLTTIEKPISKLQVVLPNVMQILYFVGSYFIRISVATFVPRLNREGMQQFFRYLLVTSSN